MQNTVTQLVDALRKAQLALNTARRFKVGSTDSYAIASEVDAALRRYDAAPSRIERSSALETFYDLVELHTADLVKGKIDRGNSRDWDFLVDWTNEFNALHEFTDWDQVDYIEAIEDFYNLKIDNYAPRGEDSTPGPIKWH